MITSHLNVWGSRQAKHMRFPLRSGAGASAFYLCTPSTNNESQTCAYSSTAIPATRAAVCVRVFLLPARGNPNRDVAPINPSDHRSKLDDAKMQSKLRI